jgi:hypothetical protein
MQEHVWVPAGRPIAELEAEATEPESALVTHLELVRAAAIVAANAIASEGRDGRLSANERIDLNGHMDDAERAAHQLDVLRRRRMQIRLFENEPPAPVSSRPASEEAELEQ